MNTKLDFIDFLIENKVLRFGDFTTKSGRKTPYFINTGLYDNGASMMQLARFYAQAFMDSFSSTFAQDISVLYGPAYKGIPLCVATSMVLSAEFNRNIAFTFNRKEAKDHGEGGLLIGRALDTPQKIVIIEDVITAGTSVNETLELLRNYPEVQVCGLLVSVDRKEKINGNQSALQEVASEYGIQTASIIDIDDIISYLQSHNGQADLLERILEYRNMYGACL
jgi:orotate phosphoribosyltransferase